MSHQSFDPIFKINAFNMCDYYEIQVQTKMISNINPLLSHKQEVTTYIRDKEYALRLAENFTKVADELRRFAGKFE